LRRFLEDVEPEVFDRIVNDTNGNLKWAKRSLDESRDRLERWRRKQFGATRLPRASGSFGKCWWRRSRPFVNRRLASLNAKCFWNG
jgi:hypothetical protein